MAKTVEYYLSKGFDRKTAEYFASGKKKITGVVPNNDFTLTISFDNGEKRLYDMRPFLKKGTVFEPFIKLENFRRVYVDNTHCIAWDIDPNIDSDKVWSNKVDLCPDGCYLDSVPVGGRSVSENCAVIIDSLIEQRHNKGMTQKELAEASSLTQSVIARLESKKATPQLDTLLKVAEALDCEIVVVPSDTSTTAQM